MKPSEYYRRLLRSEAWDHSIYLAIEALILKHEAEEQRSLKRAEHLLAQAGHFINLSGSSDDESEAA